MVKEEERSTHGERPKRIRRKQRQSEVRRKNEPVRSPSPMARQRQRGATGIEALYENTAEEGVSH